MLLQALRVTAHTPAGHVASDPYSPTLDGILAYWALRERLGEEAFALGQSGHADMVEIDDLPLGREVHDGLWWWQVSAPITAPLGRFVRHFHRRFDDAHAPAYLDRGVRKVLTAAGPYKAYRHQRTVALAPAVTWHCIGDREEIARLLRSCSHIGQGGARGWGQVERWQVTVDGDAALARLYRPLPVAFAEAHGVTGPLLEWGIRPPGRLLAHRVLCVMPDTDPEAEADA